MRNGCRDEDDEELRHQAAIEVRRRLVRGLIPCHELKYMLQFDFSGLYWDMYP